MKIFFGLLIFLLSWNGANAATNLPVRVRVMSYNIHHGEGNDGQVDLKRIAAIILQEKVDIVALQEVDRGVLRTGRIDLPAELARLTGMESYFGANINFQGGDYGNALLSRFPIISRTNLHYQMLRPNEQRGIQQIVVNARGCQMTILNTHLDYRADDSERKLNVQEIQKLIRPSLYATLLCGDFNTQPDSEVYQELGTFLTDSWKVAGQGNGWTFPSSEPNRRIDFMWASEDNRTRPVKLWTYPSVASDHAALIGDFQIAP